MVVDLLFTVLLRLLLLLKVDLVNVRHFMGRLNVQFEAVSSRYDLVS